MKYNRTVAEKVTLTYVDRGGIYSGPTEYDKGTQVTVIDCTNTCQGFDFKGWSTTNGGSVKYKVGEKFTINENTTLYAVWQPKDTTTDDGKGISITKTRVSINGDADQTTAEAGDTIEWEITVTNNSNVEKKSP